MKRSQLNEKNKKKYCWDFKHLFANNESWKKALSEFNKFAEQLLTLKGKLNNINNFKKYLTISKQIAMLGSKLVQYLHYGDLDQTNLELQQLSSLFTTQQSKLAEKLAWIQPEIKKIGFSTIKNWIANDSSLTEYHHDMEVFFKFEKFILNEHDETLLSKVSKSRNAVSGLYDTLVYADKEKTMFNYQNKEQELTQTLYLNILENSDPIKDQQLRVDVTKKFYEDIKNKKHSLAQVYESIIKIAIEEIKIRNNDKEKDKSKHLTTLEYSLLGDDVPLVLYENLVKTGQKHAILVEQFYNLKHQFFKFKKFYGSDTNLKMSTLPTKKISVEEGIMAVKKILNILGDEYLQQLNLALLPGRIDYYEDTNKRTGAYSTGGNGVEPIILMNWDDTLNSLNTLAHELGHSVHTLFVEKYQKYPNTDYPIILAEVASTVNEHLVFDYLYNNATNKQDRIYLLQTHIETVIGTFFRQIQFAEFEWEAHKLMEKETPLNADILADLFEKIANKYGQKALDKYDEKVKGYSWPRISHFFHSPYYVYKYATSITVSYKLYEDVKNGKKENLLNFLKAGGSKYPLDILKDAGVDLTQIDVYNPLLNNLQKMINQLATLITNKDN
ncbi:oligoendopeptidase F [Spiroplasma endosymbiont of Polydrusus pterygomalis]|uniref:oligoendopeptidase F n=1 Tax=Spiroplasma endosymbiont of Polydrusus pterygomalis TaxID=3139327 RepID=UPI003CCB386F